jgi:cytochrome c oxidase assembly protein subunit 15
MARSSNNPWLHRFAVFTALATLFLIWVGGLVTSHGVGMAVPDWPTTYGYNMFFFPTSQWVGGIFYEHSHRLVASGIGFLTIILCAWLWVKEERRWLRWLGVAALLAVILQGVLGGLRVTRMKDELGIFHAALAQSFFCLLGAIALWTSRWWRERGERAGRKMSIYAADGFRYLFATVTGLIFCQLVLGATMRHQHAGLAIPDFPAAYGAVWPATDSGSVARYNQARGEVRALNPITAAGIRLHMAHRFVAFAILLAVSWLAGRTVRRLGLSTALGRLVVVWLALVLGQATLGAATIWTDKAADVATAHVAMGALSLLAGVLLTLMSGRVSAPFVPRLRPDLRSVARTTPVSRAGTVHPAV